MPNYQKTGMEHLSLLLSNPVADHWANFLTDLWVASIIEFYYAPTKFMMNASNLDFSVWPNAKVVESLYKSNLCRPQTNALKT